MTEELTEAERAMIQALAAVVIKDRIKRAHEVDLTDKGRVVFKLVGEPSEAEKKWQEIQARFKRPPAEIKGGMFSPEAQALINQAKG